MKIEHRFFFALLPIRAAALAIGLVRDRLDALDRIVANERLHATLGITPDYSEFPEWLVARMLGIGDAVFASPIVVVLDRLARSRKSVALRPARMLPGLRDLTTQLHRPMLRAGILRPEWDFNFHVTLGYCEGQPFNARIDPIAWHCTEFALVHSVVGLTEHRILRRWPLVLRQYGLFD